MKITGIIAFILFASANAWAQVQFSCPQIRDMVDYNPAVLSPIFQNMDDSMIEIGEKASIVRLNGEEWPHVGIIVTHANEMNSKEFYLAYVNMLFDQKLAPEDVTQMQMLTLYRSDRPSFDWQPIRAYEISTRVGIFRYLSFPESDLAICMDSAAPVL